MPSAALELHELLLSLTLRVREIRGLTLLDRDGLPMVSTVGSPDLEETLGAFGGAMGTMLDRAQEDFQMGPLYQAHLVGRDRQLFVVPAGAGTHLVAIVESHATPATITMHLLGLALEVRPHLTSIAGHAED